MSNENKEFDLAWKVGPAMRELVWQRAAQLTTERVGGGVGDVAMTLVDKSYLGDVKAAARWAVEAVKVLQTARDIESTGVTDDESAARYILVRMYKRCNRLRGERSVVKMEEL